MTVADDLRARLTSTLHLRMGHAGTPISLTVADGLAQQALAAANVEALSGYVAAVEAGADPAAFRAALEADPVTQQLLAEA